MPLFCVTLKDLDGLAVAHLLVRAIDVPAAYGVGVEVGVQLRGVDPRGPGEIEVEEVMAGVRLAEAGLDYSQTTLPGGTGRYATQEQ